jgi:hypothetical protein
MNGKLPVKSLYTTPDTLSVNAPKQNMLAMDWSKSAWSSLMMAGFVAPYAGPLYGGGLSNMGSICTVGAKQL